MTDASPRIFRSLETLAGREGFDTIVGAAVVSYSALRSPTQAQAREFARLVVPLWDKITPDSRRSLAASLSHSPRVPREIVDLLLVETIEVSAPFLVSTPVLTSADLTRLATSRDRRLARVLTGRSNVAARSATAETDFSERPTALISNAASPVARAANPQARNWPARRLPQVEQAAASAAPSPAAGVGQPDAARPRLSAPPLVPDLVQSEAPSGEARGAPAAQARDAASKARETLRRLARTGRAAPAGTSERGASRREDLLEAAVGQDGAAFHARLAPLLGLDTQTAERIATDETGERLAVALKALDFDAADAMTILMMLKPSIGLDVRAFDSMTLYFRALDKAGCAAFFPALATGTIAATATPKHRPQYEEAARSGSEPARSEFGRRKVRPVEARSSKAD